MSVEIEGWPQARAQAREALEGALARALGRGAARGGGTSAQAWMEARAGGPAWASTAWLLAVVRASTREYGVWRLGAERIAEMAQWSDLERNALATWPGWLARAACEGHAGAGPERGQMQSVGACAQAKARRHGRTLAPCSAHALWRRALRWPPGRGAPPLLVLAASASAHTEVPQGNQAKWDAWERLEHEVGREGGALHGESAAVIAEIADKITTRGATPDAIAQARARCEARRGLDTACAALARALGTSPVGRGWNRSRRALAREALERWAQGAGTLIAQAALGALETRGVRTAEVGRGAQGWEEAVRVHLERAIARAVEHAWTRVCARNAALEGGESESATVMARLGALEHERARVRGRALATCAAPAHHAAGAQVAESARERGTARLPERLRCTQIAALGRWSPEAMRTLGRVPAWLARAGLEHLDDNDAARGETAWIAAAHARAADEHGLAHEGAGEPTQAQALARACAAWRWTQSDPPLLALARWLRAGRTAPEDDETWAGIVQEEAALRAPGALPAHNAAARRSDEASAEIIERARDAYREGGLQPLQA